MTTTNFELEHEKAQLTEIQKDELVQMALKISLLWREKIKLNPEKCKDGIARLAFDITQIIITPHETETE